MKIVLRFFLYVLAGSFWLRSAAMAQAPAADPIFESSLNYSGGVVNFTAQPGYFHRLWYHHGVATDGLGGSTLLWTLLPEQVYGTGQTVAWRLHGDIAPPPGPPPAVPPAPIVLRGYTLLAYNDGGTLIQWWSQPLQRMQRAWVPVTASPSLDLRDLSRPANAVIRVHTGMAAWQEPVVVGGVTTARLYWSVNSIPGRNLTALQVNDYDPSEQPALDLIVGPGSAPLRAQILAKLTAVPVPPPPPPSPPAPAGITLFGDHDPQQNNRPRSLYRVERLEVDSDFDLIPDHVELANPDANGDGLPDVDYNGDGVINASDWASAPPPSNAYDVMNHAFAAYPLSGTNNIPNAYEALSTVPDGVVINEVSLTGSDTLRTVNGSKPDWVELFNPTNAVVDLSGWQLRDSAVDANPALPGDPYYHFPAGTLLPSGGYLVVLCNDSATGLTDGVRLSAPFKLSAGGELVRLMRPGGPNPEADGMSPANEFTPGATPRYGVLPGGYEHSFGRAMWAFHTAGGSSLTYGWFETPTPGAMNTGVWYEGFCNPVGDVFTFNAQSGEQLQTGVNSRAFGAGFGAYITGGNPASSEFVYYTLNGAEPSPWSAVADPTSGMLDLSPGTPFNGNDLASYTTGRGFVVRARTFKAGCVPGPVVTRNFLFKEDVLGRADDPATAGVDETEPRQERPAGYPELTLPENATSYPMRYAVQPAWGTAAERAAIAGQFTDAPSIAITLPVADAFDRESAGIIAAAAATESGLPDPKLNGWERACSMQWIFEGSIGNSLPLEMPCGLDVSGRTSLAYSQTLKKGLRLSFKKKYGPGNFQITGPNPVFTDTSVANQYDELVLRGQTGDSWTSAQGSWYPSHASYSRERWARTFMADAGHFSLKSRHIHVWVNGLYWGVYMLSEVASDATLDTRLYPADWEIWKDGGEVHEAPVPAAAAATWLSLSTQAADMATAIQQGGSGAAQWAALESLVDMDNFCDYVLINGYMGNWDSMWNNGRTYRDPAPGPGRDSKIRWMIYDAEMGGNPGYLQYNWAGQPGPWTQNATTGEWRRQGWMARAADAERCGPRGMILATTTAGSNIVTFPQQVTPYFYGMNSGSGFGVNNSRLVGPGIPANARVASATSAAGLTTLTLTLNATAPQTGVPLVHYISTTTAGALLRDLTYHPSFARRMSARVHRHFYDLRPGKVGLLSADAAGDRAVNSYTERSDEFAPFKPCEYLRWGAGYSSNGSQPVNAWLGTQPSYTTSTYLPQRRGYFTTELQKHPFPSGVQPGPNPQPLYLPLEPPSLTVGVPPGTPPPPGMVAVQLDPRVVATGGTNPPGTIIRYTTNGSDPSTVEFPLYSQGQVNIPGVYLAAPGDWITVPAGTVLRARTAIVDYRTAAPPQDSDSIVERIVSESRTLTTLSL